jgi:predicted O-methyltransferase YrrM
MKKKFNQVSDILEIRNKKIRKIREYELLFLQEIANELPQNSIVLEVGSFIGKSSVCIAEILENKNSNLICLDNFSDGTIENQEILFLENIQGYNNIQVIKQDFLKC